MTLGNPLDNPRTAFDKKLTPNNIRSRLDALENAQNITDSNVDALDQITDTTGDLVVDNLICPAEGIETIEPTDTSFTGAGMSGQGKTFGSDVYHVFGVLLGVLQAGFSATTGKFTAGAGTVIADADGLTITAGSSYADVNSIKFKTGATLLSYINLVYDAVTSLISKLEITVKPQTGISSWIAIEAQSPNTDDAVIDIIARDASAIINQIKLTKTSTTLNHGGYDVDTIIKGDTTTIATFDAGLEALGVGGAAESGFPLKVTGAFKATGDSTLPTVNGSKLWIVVPKTAQEVINSDTTLSVDTHLAMNLEASSVYTIRGKIFFDTTAAADFKYRFNYSGTIARMRSRISHIIPGTTADVPLIETAFPTTTVSVVGTGTTGGFVEIDLEMNTTNAGAFSFQWAQDTSDAGNTVVLPGSYLEYLKVA